MSTSGNASNTLRRAVGSERSATMVCTLTCADLRMVSASLASKSAERATRQGLTPSPANHFATPRPMPLEAPVIITLRPVSFRSMAIISGKSDQEYSLTQKRPAARVLEVDLDVLATRRRPCSRRSVLAWSLGVLGSLLSNHHRAE